MVVASQRYAMQVVVIAGVQVPDPLHEPKFVNVVVPAGQDRVPHVKLPAPCWHPPLPLQFPVLAQTLVVTGHVAAVRGGELAGMFVQVPRLLVSAQL